MHPPISAGFSAERLARIEAYFKERYVDPGKLVGTLTLVARKGKLVYTSLLGQADRERKKPLREDAIFRLYSMSKPVTSVALMMLVEEGKIALQDPVHRFIPEWRDLGVFSAGACGAFVTTPAQSPMRVIDLLRHTSGLTYGFQTRTNIDAAYRELGIGHAAIGEGMSDPALALDQMIAALAKVPLEFSPGTAWNYSVSTDVLGYLIGKLSGMPFERFLQTRIFEPLGMADTGFSVPEDKRDCLPACYALGKDGKTVLQDDPAASAFLQPPHFVSGGGGLVGTAADYMKFCLMLLAGGVAENGARLLGPKTIELMTQNHLPGGKDMYELSVSLFSESTMAGIGFGLGFAPTTNVASTTVAGSLGAYFWGGAASTFFWCDPKEDLAIVFMTQFMPSTHYPIRRELRTLVYAAMTETNG
ncbi:MAG TPA: serine hydrolase domain-containing protein [Rhizomicrobium sp.]|nr:serine hydrolase domain-containing protein [Rhizomicrobium sp.]